MRAVAAAGFAAAGAMLCACGAGAARGSEAAMSAFTLTSPAFRAGAAIPAKFTCDGADRSPELHWGGAPAGTRELALVMDDPDAPGGTWVHWVAYGIPADRTSLPEAVPGTPTVAGLGLTQGKNSWPHTGYNGPCPPPGTPHHYHFRLYALDRDLGLAPGATAGSLERAVQGHVLATAELVGTYGRAR